VLASFEGKSDIAVGNAVGSNIFNALFILGLCALIRPLVVTAQFIARDIPVMIGVSLSLWLLCADGRLSRVEGAVLLTGLLIFTVDSIRASRRETDNVKDEYETALAHPIGARLGRAWLLVAAGLLSLVVGARLLVDSAVTIAQVLGLDEIVIGLTVVAAGTGLPEVATSLVATLRGERDIAAGNVVGSNIFNILGILGLSALVSPNSLRVSPSIENFDIPVMTAVALACLPLVIRDHRLSRWEGALFLGYYVAYTIYLLLAANQHEALEPFSATMLEFAIPLTLFVLLKSLFASRRPEAPGSVL
jgi:cation:H+ antiporter